MKTSIIVPCYNEESNIEEFYNELKKHISTIDSEFEILFINDGSEDETESKIVSIAESDHNVKLISFIKNFGHQKALKAGIDKSAYQYFKGNGDKTLALEEVQDRAIYLMLNEAIMCLEEGIIANTNDGNLGAVFGIGFLPFTGGPFRYINHLGTENVLARMNELKLKYGSKFTPRPLLIELAKTNASFE